MDIISYAANHHASRIMPTPSAALNGKLIQYIGETTDTYINGYFYKCSELEGQYTWIRTNVQPSSGSGATSYTELSDKPQINGITLNGNKSLTDLGINIPTKVSQLTNDSGYLTEHQDISNLATKLELSTEITRATNKEDSLEGSLNTHIANTSNPHNVTKEQVGLSNVDNTSDLEKPISTAVQTALDQKSTVSVNASGSATEEISYITVNGVEKKIAGGADDLFIITGTATSDTTFEVDKTKEEIQEAIDSNKLPILKMTLNGGNESIELPLIQYKSTFQTLIFESTFSYSNHTYELGLTEGASTYEGLISEKVISTVSVSSTGTAVDEISYITIDGIEKKIANNGSSVATQITLGKQITAAQTVGGISQGKVYSSTTTLAQIIEDLLSTTPTPGASKLYYGIGTTIPESVEGMTSVTVEAETLLSDGYTWKNITLDEQYPFLAIDSSLGIDCYEIIQSGFALGMVSKTIGDQKLYYPDSPITDTGVRLIYHFEEA